MKNTEDKIQKTMEYAKWLSEQLDELCISQSELASAVGRVQTTISHYVRGINMPDEATRSAIDAFIEERSVYDGFRHIPSKEFSDILLYLLDEFNISQMELAKKIGKYQKNISEYISKKEKADTGTQYDILLHFLVWYLPHNTLSTVHFGTHIQLEYLLYGSNKELAAKYQFGEKYAPTKCVEFILSLPTGLQKLILNNASAFVDSNSLDTGSYQAYKSCMELYRQLSSHYKYVIRSELEKYAQLRVPHYEQLELDFFDHILAYYDVIRYNVLHFKKHNELFSTKQETDEDKFIDTFEKALQYADIWNDEIAEEIHYKIGFDADEWYIWMLFVMYDHQGKGIEYLKNEMLRYVNIPEPKEQTKMRYPINKNLMLRPKNDK